MSKTQKNQTKPELVVKINNGLLNADVTGLTGR